MFIEKNKFMMPELEGGKWVNSHPLSTASLRGNPVLVDFWDYTCVNCLRTLPYIKEWNSRYSGLGLSVIGVHAPEFQLAREEENILRAIEKFDIRYPVVMDNDYAIWKAFSNKYWPAKYLSDKDGFLRYAHFGEGSYIETELAIQLLLREVEPGVELPDLMKPVRDTDIPGIHCYKASPELYFGHHLGKPGNPEGIRSEGVVDYTTEFQMKDDTIYFGGRWLVSKEYSRPALTDGDSDARVHLRYTSSEVNIVISPEGEKGFKVFIMQDDAYLAPEDMGDDVKTDTEGRTFIEVDEPRMYNIVKNGEFGTRRLKLSTSSNACSLHAFTFVSCTV
ncbi:MAG: redoxin domain-containing protein [Thermodesulfobacteriota bacterium]